MRFNCECGSALEIEVEEGITYCACECGREYEISTDINLIFIPDEEEEAEDYES